MNEPKLNLCVPGLVGPPGTDLVSVTLTVDWSKDWNSAQDLGQRERSRRDSSQGDFFLGRSMQVSQREAQFSRNHADIDH